MQLAIKFGRSLVSGAAGALVNLLALFMLHAVLDMWYLSASAIAFCGGVLVNFVLQKMWVFTAPDMSRVGYEVGLFLLLGSANLIVNTGGMYVFVSVLNIHYLLAQIVLAAALAILNFLLYGRIFKRHA